MIRYIFLVVVVRYKVNSNVRNTIFEIWQNTFLGGLFVVVQCYKLSSSKGVNVLLSKIFKVTFW